MDILAPIKAPFKLANSLVFKSLETTIKSFSNLRNTYNVLKKSGSSTFTFSNFISTYSNNFTDFYSYCKYGPKIPAVYHSLDVINNAVQTVDKAFYTDEDSEEPIDKNQVPSDIKAISQNPNPWMDYKTFVSYYVFDILLTGNSIWLLDEVNGRGQPKGVYRIPPYNVSIIKDADRKIAYYQITINGSNKTNLKIPPEQIVHLKWNPNPIDECWGLGVIAGAESVVNHAQNINSFMESFLKNGAQPSGIVTPKAGSTINNDQMKRAELSFKEKYSGSDNAGKTLFLGAALQYEKTGLDTKDLEIIQDSIVTMRKIFMMFYIPASLQYITGDDQPKYLNAQQDELNFRKYMVSPVLELFDQGWSDVLSNFSKPLILKHDDVTDFRDIENLEKDLNLGAITINEFRKYRGYNPSTESASNILYTTMNKIPLRDTLFTSAATTAALTAPGGKPSQVGEGDVVAAVVDAEESPEELDISPQATVQTEQVEETRFVDMGKERTKSWRDKNSGGWHAVPEKGIWTVKDFSETPTIARIQRDFLRLARATQLNRRNQGTLTYQEFLNQQLTRLTDNLEGKGLTNYSKKTSTDDVIDEIWDDNIENAALIAAGSALYLSMTDAAYENVQASLTIEIGSDARNASVAKNLNLMRSTAPRINDTTKEDVRRVISKGLAENKTRSEIAADLRASSAFNLNRSNLIARNELRFAYDESAMNAMKDSGVVKTIDIVGCEDNLTDCNRTGVPIDQASNLVFHPNHTGTAVPGTFNI